MRRRELNRSELVSLGCHSKRPQAGWLEQQTFIFSQVWRLEVQDQDAGRISSKASLFSLQMTSFLLCSYLASPLCVERENTPVSVSLPLMWTLVPADQGPTLMTSFNFNYLLKGLLSKYSDIGGLGIQRMIWGVGTQFSLLTIRKNTLQVHIFQHQ